MSDETTLSARTGSGGQDDGVPAGRRACLFCTRLFAPKKDNQRFCKPAHRRKALRLREQLESLLLATDRMPRLSASAIVRRIAADCRRAGVPAPDGRSAYLSAVAKVVEAQEQRRRWDALLREREQALAQEEIGGWILASTTLRSGEPFKTDPSATHLAVACTDPSLAVLVIGRRT